MKTYRLLLLTALASSTLINTACAHEHYTGGIQASSSKEVLAPFDIVHAKITSKGNIATFHMAVSGKAGIRKPSTTGKLAGSNVFSYVWPTSIDSYEVGFEVVFSEVMNQDYLTLEDPILKRQLI
jgi:hypothetical protein